MISARQVFTVKSLHHVFTLRLCVPDEGFSYCETFVILALYGSVSAIAVVLYFNRLFVPFLWTRCLRNTFMNVSYKFSHLLGIKNELI